MSEWAMVATVAGMISGSAFAAALKGEVGWTLVLLSAAIGLWCMAGWLYDQERI